jgi:hypothetical protein
MIQDVAALFVDPRGSYPSVVEHWWDERRDARTYSLSLPIVAHPPCQRWCRLAGLVEARWGHKRGEDGGCFASALASLRRVGGVIEHPAYSDAWAAHGLPRPPTGAGWVPGARVLEWTCYVEQWRYGHKAKKATWLYYLGLTRPFDLLFDHVPDQSVKAWVSWCRNKTCGAVRPRLTHKEAIATPPAFREVLIALARHSRQGRVAA